MEKSLLARDRFTSLDQHKLGTLPSLFVAVAADYRLLWS